MLKRITSAAVTACLVLCLAVMLCTGAAAAGASLTAGTTYQETSLTQISAESGEIILVSPAVQNDNGIALKAEAADGGKSLKLSYSGTPVSAGTTEFSVSYTDGGLAKEVKVQFTVSAAVQTPDKPVINSVSPSTVKNPVRQTDPEIVFSVDASGNGKITYEWVFDGAVVSTDAKYTFTPANATVGDHYLECVVTNTLGDTSRHTTDNSPGWSITVAEGEAPKITNKASAAEIKGSGSVKFTVEATGDGLTYQWYILSGSNKERVSDGTYGAISYSGGTTNTLKITCTSAPKTVTTKFVCEVKNAGGMTATTGEYTLYVTEDASLSKVQSISVSKMPSKTTYTVGETLNTSGMEVEVVTGKGTEKLTSDFVCSPTLLETEGTQRITVSYGGKTTSFNVTVKKADHTHEWSEWFLDEKDADNVVVYRKCTVSDCDAKEEFTKDEFLKKYPADAKKLGIEEEKSEDDDKNSEDNTDNTDDADKSDSKDDKSDTGKKKTGSNTVLWCIIAVAAVLLAAACAYYVKVYKKPYKKPNSTTTKKSAKTGSGRGPGGPRTR